MKKILILAVLSMFVFVGCDDGNDGKQGPAGKVQNLLGANEVHVCKAGFKRFVEASNCETNAIVALRTIVANKKVLLKTAQDNLKADTSNPKTPALVTALDDAVKAVANAEEALQTGLKK